MYMDKPTFNYTKEDLDWADKYAKALVDNLNKNVMEENKTTQ